MFILPPFFTMACDVCWNGGGKIKRDFFLVFTKEKKREEKIYGYESTQLQFHDTENKRE